MVGSNTMLLRPSAHDHGSPVRAAYCWHDGARVKSARAGLHQLMKIWRDSFLDSIGAQTIDADDDNMLGASHLGKSLIVDHDGDAHR